MSTETSNSTRYLLLVLAVVAVCAVFSLFKSVKSLFAVEPAAQAAESVALDDGVEQGAVRKVRTVSNPTWKAYKVDQSKVPKQIDPSEFKAQEPKVAGLAAESADLRARQIAGLREDLAQNSNDDQDATPSKEEIARMETEGVMVW